MSDNIAARYVSNNHNDKDNKTNLKSTKKRILIIDDEEDNNLIFKVVLEDNGFDVNTFIDPLEALQDLRTGLYDLVLLDIRMPTMDGLSVYQEIRKLDDIVKVCFLTAGVLKDEELARQIFPTAIQEERFIQKPVNNEELVKRAKEILRE
jgi:CheY-like chemotaxis protein